MDHKTLGVFFTKGVSVERWEKMDLLEREKLLYEEFIKKNIFDSIYWFTYGSDDKKYEKYLQNGIIIIPKPVFFNIKYGSLLYSFLLPLLQKRYIKECTILKTNQMPGSWSAVISKIIYKSKLLIRTGYTMTLFLKNKKFLRFIYRLVEKLAYKFADHSIVTSKHDKQYIISNYNIKSDVSLIHNFVDMNLFRHLGIEKDKDIVFVGRLTDQKNLFSLIEAMENLDYSLDIYGSGVLGVKLSDFAKSKNVKINFIRNIPNSKLPYILNHYKMYILPSFYEGMPKTLIEAMACGMACLGTNVNGTNELIKNKVNGLLINTDTLSIRNGIIELMGNRKLREDIGKQARISVENSFNLESIVKKENMIYKQLMH
ncbi:glycosyltransferase [Patescibacteria group bacterium]|nr:glycosyltransferase [Patescibacteria group bacterium]MBU1952089.1 glycosyltransferase [Patescibacteria group bacterium]